MTKMSNETWGEYLTDLRADLGDGMWGELAELGFGILVMLMGVFALAQVGGWALALAPFGLAIGAGSLWERAVSSERSGR